MSWKDHHSKRSVGMPAGHPCAVLTALKPCLGGSRCEAQPAPSALLGGPRPSGVRVVLAHFL